MMAARCHCGRFLGEVVIQVVNTPVGHAVGKVRGRCACHGRVDSIESMSWDEAFGDWDPLEAET